METVLDTYTEATGISANATIISIHMTFIGTPKAANATSPKGASIIKSVCNISLKLIKDMSIGKNIDRKDELFNELIDATATLPYKNTVII